MSANISMRKPPLACRCAPFLILFACSLPGLGTPAHADETPAETSADERWSAHFQATAVPQYHPDFSAAYSGPLSLSPGAEYRVSYTSTLFLGARLPWRGAQVYVDPELSAGSGLSATHGVAGYPNGEIYRVDSPEPKFNLSRAFLRQSFVLGDAREIPIEPDKNQLGGRRASSALTVTAGKFSLNDFFDANSYSHDPRTQFLNWGFMDNGAWDYAADTRGYTWAVMLEIIQPGWTLRLASALEPAQANQLDFDPHVFLARGDNAELELHYSAADRPGIARFLAYANHAHMGSYRLTLDHRELYGTDVTQTADYRTKYGLGINLEQDLGHGAGAFFRAGWNDGATESWAFTEIDRTVSLGVSVAGDLWHRPLDTFGAGGMINGLSKDHADYISTGGQGFILGDGALTYAPEQACELYYQFQPLKGLALAADFQYVNHPGYNAARGPVPVFALRLHAEL